MLTAPTLGSTNNLLQILGLSFTFFTLANRRLPCFRVFLISFRRAYAYRMFADKILHKGIYKPILSAISIVNRPTFLSVPYPGMSPDRRK